MTLFRFVALTAIFSTCGCATAPKTESERDVLHSDVQAALKSMKSQDAQVGTLLDKAYAYAVFPQVGRGALIVGGSYGHAEVYQGGEMIGYADVSQATVGAQAGGETFAELIVFENKAALDEFRANKMRLTGGTSVVALKSGEVKPFKFTPEGWLVVIQQQSGLMAEISVGGQTFSFMPK